MEGRVALVSDWSSSIPTPSPILHLKVTKIGVIAVELHVDRRYTTKTLSGNLNIPFALATD